MSSRPLTLDTSPAIEQIQIEGWRRMGEAQKSSLISNLTQSAIQMTRAGIDARHPGASPHQQRLRLAIILLGRELATRAFPESAALEP